VAVTPIFHITHIRNLISITAQNGLCCDLLTAERGLDPVGIAHRHIKERRARRQVTAAVQGTLADYVPFYFAPRSPMLYSINRGAVEGYTEGQQPIVHLVASAERVVQERLPFAFTDGHAEMVISRFFDDLRWLDQVDWPLMRATYWNDTPADGDRKRRRQAEFLVHRFFPWALVEEIGVQTEQMARQVHAVLAQSEHRPQVAVCRHWYY
jgi:hypothetical protein